MAVVPWDVTSLKIGGVEAISSARAASFTSGAFSTTLAVTGNSTLTGLVGIGTAPSTYPLRVARATASDVALLRLQNDTAGRASVLQFNNSVGNAYIGREATTPAVFAAASADALVIGTTGAHLVEILTNNILALAVDSAQLVTAKSHLRFNGILYGNSASAGVATTGGARFTGIVQTDAAIVGNAGTGKVGRLTGDSHSLANLATITVGATSDYHGLFLISDTGSNLTGMFNVGPTSTTLESDPGARFSNTKDTSGRVNVYVETSNLIVQNLEGSTRGLRLVNLAGVP